MQRSSSPVNEDRQSTIISGEMYPEGGISERMRRERFAADKCNFGNAGNEMPSKESDCRRGADPPRNESGRPDAVEMCGGSESSTCISSGKGRPNATASRSNAESRASWMQISRTRSLWNRAPSMFAVSDKLQVEATWHREPDGSPPSAHVYQRLPYIFPGFASFTRVETKYFDEDIVGKHASCNIPYVPTVSGG